MNSEPRSVRPASPTGYLAVVLLAAWLVGCGASPQASQLEVTPVTGSVFFRNQPASGAVVRLHPILGPAREAGLYPQGKVDDGGEFQLTTYTRADGAPAGEYRVTIVWPDPTYRPGTPQEGEEIAMGGQPPDRLQGRYSNAGQSSFQLTVRDAEGSLEMPRIDLK